MANILKIAELSVPESVKEVLLGLGISELFPPQEDTIRAGVLEGKNIVLASPTASGKTLIAELCALKHVLENGGKVIYLSPLRALASEKFEEFKKYTSIRKVDGRKVSVGISTGDFDSADNWLERYDIIITTNEKADSLLAAPRQMDGQHLVSNCRRNSPFKRRWTWTNLGNCVGKADAG